MEAEKMENIQWDFPCVLTSEQPLANMCAAYPTEARASQIAAARIEKCNQTKMKNRIKHEYTNSSQIVVFIKVSGSGGGVVVVVFFAAAVVVDAQRSKIFALTEAEHNEMYAQKCRRKKSFLALMVFCLRREVN